MRHRIKLRKLNRTSEHKLALRRNMAQDLFEHGQITTTVPKAKNLRPFAERLVALAVKYRKFNSDSDQAGALRVRRAIHSMLSDRSIIPSEHRSTYEGLSDAARRKSLRMASGRRYRTGEPKGRLDFTGESVTHRLIETIASKYEDRPGGYTRLIHLAKRRVGDNSALAIVQLVGDEEAPTSLTKPQRSSRRRRADSRYAMAIKAAKSWAAKGSKKSAPAPVSDEPESDSANPEAESSE